MVQKAPSLGSRVIVIATVAILAALIGIMVAQRVSLLSTAAPQLSQGTVLRPARELPVFALVDQHNQPFTNQNLSGHWSLMFFGFTNCPDICPTTLAALGEAERKLADLGEQRRPQVLFVSVDPERDTPDKLAAYIGFFGSSFAALTGPTDRVDQFTKSLGVPVMRTALPDGGYTVDHSAAVFVINPAGKLQALLSAPHRPAALAADYRRILAN
jgi:protein SCO1/2